MGRSPCCSKVGMMKGPWKSEEDKLLVRYIAEHGEGNWRALPKQAGLLRCGKSCRLRWLNYLRPNTKRGNISEDEEKLIITLHSLLGNRWSLIAGRIPGRTDNEIKNYWNAHLSKKLLNKGLYPSTHEALHVSCRSSRKSRDRSKEKYCRSECKSHTSIIELDCSRTETGRRRIPVSSVNTCCPSSAEKSEESNLLRKDISLLGSQFHKTMELESPSYSITSPTYRSESFSSGFQQKNSLSSIDSEPLQATACFDFRAEPLEDSILTPNRSFKKIMQFPSSYDKEVSTSTQHSWDCIIQENDDSEVTFDSESLQQLQSLTFWNENLEIDELWDPIDQMTVADSYSSSSIMTNKSQEEDYLSDIFSNFY